MSESEKSWSGLAWVAGCLLWVGATGCVETADCNESVRCPEGEVCFRYECRSRCEKPADCDRPEGCRPCVDPETEENRCFGEQVRACVPEES